MDTIRSKGLLVRHCTNSFFDFCWCYINILLLVAVHLFCYFLNPVSTFIVFYIFSPYFRPEFSIFFPYPILYSLHVSFHPIPGIRLEQPVLPILVTLFLYCLRVAVFGLTRCLTSSAALLYPFLLT